MITYHIMTESEKEEISSWNYTGEYQIYNMPSYKEQLKQGIAFGNPSCEKHFYAYYEENKLIGFTNISEEAKETFIGIGIAPAICGMGYGQKILQIAQSIANTLYPNKPLYLEVRTWNERAIRCYQKAGFTIDGEILEQETMIGTGRFFRMIYDPKVILVHPAP